MTDEHVPHMPTTPGGRQAAKLALRDQVLAARRRRPLAESARDAELTGDHLLATGEVRRAATVAAYVSVGREPGTGLLLDRLHAAGKRVLLPVLLGDNDLDWAAWTGSAGLVAASRGMLEPDGPRLGVSAVATADAVLVPGLAVSPTGMRLGRGGGSYDRVLGRVADRVFTCVLLHVDEVGLDVPAEPHDRRVQAAATADGVIRFPAPAAG